MPASSWSFLDHPTTLAFAHRGGASDAPENTMPAFEAAVALGYRYLETDVHLTADGVLLAFHDDFLDRVTDRTGEIAKLPYSEVAKAKVDGREPIPKLEELLDAWPDVRVNIDPKHDESVDALAGVIKRTNSVGRVCIGAFSDKRLERVRGLLGADLCTSLGPKGVAKLRAASYHLPAGQLPAACVQVPHRAKGLTLVDERFVATAHDRGLQVHVWTIDDADEMRELLDLGVDGIMTDRPTVLRTVLEERSDWT
jgi:glycerophosphoryl diester phosphodiesterase